MKAISRSKSKFLAISRAALLIGAVSFFPAANAVVLRLGFPVWPDGYDRVPPYLESGEQMGVN